MGLQKMAGERVIPLLQGCLGKVLWLLCVKGLGRGGCVAFRNYFVLLEKRNGTHLFRVEKDSRKKRKEEK